MISPPSGRAIATLLLPLALCSISCGADEPVGRIIGGGVQPTLSSIQQNVFTPSCALSGCHAPPAPQLGQDLSPGSSYTSLVNVSSVERPELYRITPGDPNGSYLYMKITEASGILGSRMPQGAAPLPPDAILAIRTWIEDGAPND